MSSPPAMLPDHAVRTRALDPARSFIVQAPAGSGKTELLIQRFLRLLACVDEPEQVLAVTFTRKAAGEMRNRVVAALRQAAGGEVPEAPHLRISYELARDVLADPRRALWQLQRHPARLGIGTIDSLNAWIAARAPLGAAAAVAPTVAEAPERLYREAARATLALIAGDDEYAGPVAALLAHLDYDAARFERLLVAMLPRRDQWLRHLAVDDSDRDRREAALAALTAHGLETVAAQLGGDVGHELVTLLDFAAGQVPADSPQIALARTWAGRKCLPSPVSAELPAWQALANLLLTSGPQGTWRKRLTVTEGFPPGAAEKQRMVEFLTARAGDTALRDALLTVRLLPGARYSDAQWTLLGELLAVLRLAAAELRLVFAAAGQVDFPEIAAAALEALGTEDQPTELHLALDQRIRHILVDEFQDTSLAQFDLLRQLVAGWLPGDGRSLFLVGDPMQSIYRFRQAEVSLFLRVRDDGLGPLHPEFLQLTANFRSLPAVVEWNNQAFATLLPAQDDPVSGAVAWCPSRAVRAADAAGGVTCHWLRAGEPALEAAQVLELVQDAGRRHGHAGTCILVRTRSHVAPLIAALRAAGVPFVAPDMEHMDRSDVALDLLALTRALLDPADRLAWVGVLRSPLCGLSLADLALLLEADHARAVPELLRLGLSAGHLSSAGQAIGARLLGVVDRVAPLRGRIGLRELVEAAWLGLGGPATLREAGELDTARLCLHLIETLGADRSGFDPVDLGTELERQQGSLGGVESGVQVMTVHKAKGLEFETVIVPGLARRPRQGGQPLLLWHELTDAAGGHEPVLAPIAARDGTADALYSYLGHLEGEKERFEAARLLYVACTRARQALHLVATLVPHAAAEGEGISARRPPAGSLLGHLWPLLEPAAHAAAATMDPVADGAPDQDVWVQPLIRRLPPDWAAPALAAPVPGAGPVAGDGPLIYEWVSPWARQAGVVVHEWLQRFALPGAELPQPAAVVLLEPELRRRLKQLGTAPGDLGQATARVAAALAAAVGTARGRWLLSDTHRDARSEWALTVVAGGGFRQLVIDRSFVSDGVRWIIDYKTTSHEGGDRAVFLHEQALRHEPQLRAYREAVSALGDAEPVRTALWFPLIGAFVEIDAAGTIMPEA